MRGLFAAGLFIALAGCGPFGQKSTEEPPKVEAAKAITDAQQVLEGLRAANLPIDKVRTVTAESDGNKLLGRPHQYTSKIDFIDTRFPEGKIEAATNYIEVFADPEDALRRRDYVDGIVKSIPMFTQYLILRKNVLLRVDGAVSPDAAKEYEAAIIKIVG